MTPGVSDAWGSMTPGVSNSGCCWSARGLSDERMKLTPHETRSLAVAAMVDPRSIVKAIEGRPLAPLTLTRIQDTLEKLGRLQLLPQFRAANLAARLASGASSSPPAAA